MLQDKIKEYSDQIQAFTTGDAEALEQFRITYLGSKGIVKAVFEEFKTVSPEEKRTLGKVLNVFKQLAEARYQELSEAVGEKGSKGKEQMIDLTLPGEGFEIGSRHPLAIVREKSSIF